MASEFSSLSLSDRVIESLEAAKIPSIQALSKYTKQQLIDISGIGATSADRILAAIDDWFAESNRLRSLSTEVVGSQDDKAIVNELLSVCDWAQDVFYQLGNQRGMYLGGQMRMKTETIRAGLRKNDEVKTP